MICDVLAFGIHPDDLEIGIFGTLAKEVDAGKKVILIDLTLGEMGSNGTPEIRKNEAGDAAKIIGAYQRYTLDLKDRGIRCDEESIRKIVEVIRRHQPSLILFPYFKDYHPDHENGSKLIKEAIHFSGLIKYELENTSPHKVTSYGMYYINDVENPNTYIDISTTIEKKIGALNCHVSQFGFNEGSIKTYLNTGFLEGLRSRDRYFGTLCGCLYAEAVYMNKIKPHQHITE